MKMKIGLVLVLLLTFALLLFVVYRLSFEGVELFSPKPDLAYPKPVVELFLEREGKVMVISDDTSLGRPPLRHLGLILRLINNSSEPSIRGAFAAGVLVALSGARVEGYELGGFSGIIGASENGSIMSPINSSIVEFFVNKLDPWQSIEAKLHLIVENESDCVQIAYRGWIIDEDDVVIEPLSNAREHYIARFPQEEYPDNPPDSRWAGKDFMMYKVYRVNLCFD